MGRGILNVCILIDGINYFSILAMIFFIDDLIFSALEMLQLATFDKSIVELVYSEC